MDFDAHYAKNAALHGQLDPRTIVAARKELPDRPSGGDWAMHWTLLHVPPGGACLDVGCAQLSLLLGLAGHFSRRVGIDVVQYPVWAEHPDIETHLLNLDRGDLPFEDGSFDLVTLLMVLEHVFDPYHALRELRRVVSPRGHVVVHVPNIAGFRHRASILLGRLPITASRPAFEEDSWDGQHIHQFTQASLTWLLRRVGLEPVAWGVTGRAAKLRARWPSLLGNDLVVRCVPRAPVIAPPDF